MPKPAFKSLNEQGILQKLVVAIMLMVVIPLLLVLYLLHNEAEALLQKDSAQLTIFWMICSSVCGYIIIRRMVVAVMRLAKDAQSIVQGDLTKKLNTSEKNELDLLANNFNQITSELEKNIEELKESKKILQSVLLRIGSAMASAKKIEDILELTIEILTNALNAQSGTIMLLEKGGLRIMVSYGLDDKRHESLEIPSGTGIIGWVAQERKPQNITRTEQDRRFDVEAKMGLAHKSIICVPVLFQDKTIGTISLHDKRNEEGFSPDDLILLENLAAQVAIALENSRLNQDIERSYVETISALALVVEAKDPYSRGHAKRVSQYVAKIAEELKLDKEQRRILQDAALLHDIGKIGIKDSILLKTSILTAEEKKEMDRHAIIGETILKPIQSLKEVAYLVRHHQEQENGKGYPDGLTGEQMPLSLKVLIIADAYDAMTSDRPYRKGMTKEETQKELLKYSGIYFDPQVVEVFLKIL